MLGGLSCEFHPARLLKDVLVSLFVLALMSATAFPTPQGAQQVPEKSIPVTRLVVTFGTNTTPIWQAGIWDELRIVIRDRATWENTWKRIFSPDPYHDPYQAMPPLPEIDFSQEMLIVAAMGRRPSSNYQIMVDGARERNNRVEVEVHNISICTSALGIITAPIDIVRIPRTDLPVTFNEIEVKRGCK